ncbi:hypothetical protein [Nocardia tenerifensis]|nr:hypothetical protein [Nocardia tenerifensis]
MPSIRCRLATSADISTTTDAAGLGLNLTSTPTRRTATALPVA